MSVREVAFFVLGIVLAKVVFYAIDKKKQR